jgi:trigger factor
MVKKRFRPEIEREVLDRLVPRYWKQAEAESELDPLLPPDVDEVDLRAGEPLTFVAIVEVRPEIELGDTGDFELPEADTEPSESEVDDALAGLQSQVADWTEVERAAARGDMVHVHSVELGEDGEPLGEPQHIDVEIGDARIWEELSLALTGLEAGQSTEFKRQEGEGEEAQVRHFKVEAHSVREKDLPPLDDELAKKFGDFESLAALREHIEERLKHEKHNAARTAREQAMLEQLRSRHPLDLPEGVVEEETRQLLQEYAENLARQGVDVENTEIDWAALGGEVKPQAERRVHVRLLLDAVAEAEQIEVDPEEFEGRLAVVAKAQGRTTTSLRQALGQSGQLDALRRQMCREKTIDRLLGTEDAPDEG